MYTWLYISSKLCKSILYQSQKSFLCFSSPCLNLSCSQHYVIPSFQSWVKFYSFWHLGLAERESHTRTNWTAKFCENFENPLKSKYTQKTVCAVAWKSKAYFTFLQTWQQPSGLSWYCNIAHHLNHGGARLSSCQIDMLIQPISICLSGKDLLKGLLLVSNIFADFAQLLCKNMHFSPVNHTISVLAKYSEKKVTYFSPVENSF